MTDKPKVKRPCCPECKHPVSFHGPAGCVAHKLTGKGKPTVKCDCKLAGAASGRSLREPGRPSRVAAVPDPDDLWTF